MYKWAFDEDDLIILADSLIVMHLMTNSLHEYCVQWNLIINMRKSKVIMFRNGSKQSISEKWSYKNEYMEVVTQYEYVNQYHYEYLGVIFTSSSSLKAHFKNCVTAAMYRINRWCIEKFNFK